LRKKFIATFSTSLELSWQTNTSQNLNISIFRQNLNKFKKNVTNPWVELTLENRLARGSCLRSYKHIIKLILNLCGTLRS